MDSSLKLKLAKAAWRYYDEIHACHPWQQLSRIEKDAWENCAIKIFAAGMEAGLELK